MSKTVIKTNRFSFDIDWRVFFQRYKIFYIKVSCNKEKHRSIYDLLSEIPAKGKPVSVSYGWALEGGLKKEFFLMTSVESNLSGLTIRNALKSKDFNDCTIEELNEGDKLPSIEKVANMLLSYLPNYDDNICYADGQLYLGNCLDWNKHYARHGELTFLHVSFSNGGFGILCLNSEAVTFTEEDKFKKSKYYQKYNIEQITKSRPFYINYAKAQIFAARICDEMASPFYKLKVYARQNDNNHIDFLNYKDENTLASCQATVVTTIIEALQKAYGDFMSLEQICYDAECYETKTGCSHLNKIEEKYMEHFLASFGFAVEIYDASTADCKDTAKATLQALSFLNLHIVEGASENTAVFRVLPSWVKEKLDLENASETKRAKVKRDQCIDKQRYQKQLIPVQDLTPDKVKLSESDAVIKKNKNTIYNLLRQLCVKNYVLKGSLPMIMAERYKGALVIYGKSIPKTKDYDVVKAVIDEAGTIKFDYDRCNSSGEYIVFDGHRIQTRRLYGGLSQDTLFWIKIGDLEIQIFDSDEFVNPNCAYIAEHIAKGLKTASLKNKGVRDLAFGAFIGIHYWEDDDCNWCYSAGQRQSAMNGTTTAYSNKTHIRHLRTNRPMSRQEMEDYIVANLEEGWMRKNNNSVHPSIFKFLHEAMEIYKTRHIANS